MDSNPVAKDWVVRADTVLPWLTLGALLLAAVAITGEGHLDFLDDSFITYQYARNLASGHGLRYNAADLAPFEGFSSLLHTLLVSLALELGSPPLVATRVLGFLVLGSLPLAFACAPRPAHVSARAALLAGAACTMLLLALDETRVHLASGMETMLFVGLLAWTCVWILRFVSEPPSRRLSACGALLCGLLMLARPEGLPLAGLCCAGLVLHALLRRRQALGSTLVLGAAVGLCALAYLAWKRAYFGNLLPGPYYVKSHNLLMGSSGVRLPGLNDLRAFLLQRFVPLALLVGLVAPAGQRRLLGRQALVLAPCGLALLLYARVVHEVTPGYRYEYPYLLPLLLLASLGLATRLACLGAQERVTLAACAGATLFVLWGETPRPLTWLKEPRAALSAFARPVNTGAHVAIAQHLQRTGLGQQATVALDAAGIIPYLSGMRALDLAGLNDRTLSGEMALSVRDAWQYVHAQHPDLMVSILPPATSGVTRAEDEPLFATPIGKKLLAGPFTALYRFWDPARVKEMLFAQMCAIRDRYQFGLAEPVNFGFYLIVYVARSSPHRERILRAFAGQRARMDHVELASFYVNDPRGDLTSSVAAHGAGPL